VTCNALLLVIVFESLENGEKINPFNKLFAHVHKFWCQIRPKDRKENISKCYVEVVARICCTSI